MEKKVENHLTAALKRLEKASEELLRVRGLNRESESLKVLTELLREQVNDENPRPTISQTR